MGKNRDRRRAHAHHAQQNEPPAVTHIELISPVWNKPFWHDVHTGENMWVWPSDAVVRPATPKEQAMLNTIEKTGTADVWVYRAYGIMSDGYWYCPSRGSVQRASPY